MIPRLLHERVQGLPLSSLELTPDTHARKRRMYELSDAFLALPGGIGTVEEFFELYTWCQLGLHAKPIGLANTAGFYQPLLSFLDAMVREGFLRPAHRASFLVGERPDTLLDALHSYRPVYVDKLGG